jgi:hypothetical protein
LVGDQARLRSRQAATTTTHHGHPTLFTPHQLHHATTAPPSTSADNHRGHPYPDMTGQIDDRPPAIFASRPLCRYHVCELASPTTTSSIHHSPSDPAARHTADSTCSCRWVMVRDGDSKAAPAVYLLTAGVATHGSPLGPLAFDARFAPPNRGGDAVRDCPCQTEVRRRCRLYADRRCRQKYFARRPSRGPEESLTAHNFPSIITPPFTLHSSILRPVHCLVGPRRSS